MCKRHASATEMFPLKHEDKFYQKDKIFCVAFVMPNGCFEKDI